MLKEPEVIDAVCLELISRGYHIEQKLGPRQTGDDIIAVRYEPVPRKLFLEAKGETSSQPATNRYGRPFNSAQVRVHVAQAFYKAAEVLSREQSDIEVRAGIALPSTDRHRALVAKIQPVLDQLDIATFWVHEKSVSILSGWTV